MAMFDLMTARVTLEYTIVGDVQVIFVCDRSNIELIEINSDIFWVQKGGWWSQDERELELNPAKFG